MQIKVDDIVEVRVGDDRGERGRVLNVDRRTGKVLVEGINRVYKHVRRSQRNPQGGRLSKEMPVQASNVLMVCTKCGKPTRLGVRYEATGSKVRYCRKCGAGLGEVSPERAAYAQQK